jgi:hypothetical protein
MTARLEGAQAVPANASSVVGNATIALDTARNTLTYRIELDGLGDMEASAHIHGPAAPGTIGEVLHVLPVGVVKEGVWAYNDSPDEANILAGLTYMSVHMKGGVAASEIRGQIVRVPDPSSDVSSWGLIKALYR